MPREIQVEQCVIEETETVEEKVEAGAEAEEQEG